MVSVAGTSAYRFAPNGTPTLVKDIEGAASLNGLTLFRPGVFLAADDTANTIWKIDLASGKAQSWLTSPLLVPSPDGLPIGPNGLKLFGGAVYISVTGAETILRVPILPDGSAGTPMIYASSLQADDFAFGSDGSIFAATQGGTIVHLLPNGTRTLIPTGTLGDAAVAFGRTAADLQDIYVVNNGGAFLGLPDGPSVASIVRLSVGTTGVTPESQATPEPSSLLLTATAVAVVLGLKRRAPSRGTKS